MIRPLLLITLVLVACGRPRAAPPTPDQTTRPPDLGGLRVLVLPAQKGPDRFNVEFGYWLGESAPRVNWVLPAQIDRLVARSPALALNPRELDVAVFRRAQVRRIGDPLFGDLRKLAAVFDARLALVPVAAEFKATNADRGRLEVALALIDTSFGEVLWFGMVASDEDTADSDAVAISAAQRAAALFARNQRSR